MKKLIIISISLVILTRIVYAERVKIRTIQHRPVGGFVKFETLGDTTLQEVTIGKKATTSGTQIKLTDDMYIGSSSNTAVMTAEDIVVYGSMTVVGNMVAKSSFNITGTSNFGGATSFNDGLNVSDDLYVIGTFTASGLATGTSFTKVSGGEFKVDTLRSESTEIDGHSFPVPSTTNATWQTITYAKEEGGYTNSIGVETEVSYSLWNAQTDACTGDDKYSKIANVATFCDGKPDNHDCEDYFVDIADRYDVGIIYTYSVYDIGCPNILGCSNVYSPSDGKLPYIPNNTEGCPLSNYFFSDEEAWSCYDLCEIEKGSSCTEGDLDIFYEYTDSEGVRDVGFDSYGDWLDPVNLVGETYNAVYMMTFQNCTGSCCNQDYAMTYCLPQTGETWRREITCNIPSAGDTGTITVLGYN